jgi:hypothetical protein
MQPPCYLLPAPEYTHPNQNQINPPSGISIEFMEWLGYWYGDGCFENNRAISFIVSLDDGDVYDKMMWQTWQWFCVPYRRPSRRHSQEFKASTVVGVRWMKSIGIDSKLDVPGWIKTTPIEFRLAWIRGIFEADACVHIRHNTQHCSFYWTNKSKLLCEWVATVLQEIAVTDFTIYSTQVSGKDYWHIRLKRNAYKAYADRIGFIGKRKTDVLAKMLQIKPSRDWALQHWNEQQRVDQNLDPDEYAELMEAEEVAMS